MSAYLAVPAGISLTWWWVTNAHSVSQLYARPTIPEPAESLPWGSCPYKIFQTRSPGQGEFLCSILYRVLTALLFWHSLLKSLLPVACGTTDLLILTQEEIR